MTKLKTNSVLLKAIQEAAATKLTVDELHRQRVSFIMGSLKETSGVTRAQVEDIVKAQEGRANGDTVRANAY